MKKEAGDNSFGVASVVLGILSILSLSVLGIILGAVGGLIGVIVGYKISKYF